MPRVLIVDDSPTSRLALLTALSKDPDIEVIGTVASGSQALRQIERQHPDLVTMDVHLQGESGIEVTARIMADWPVPILIVTGHDPTDAELVYQALEAGALEVCGKPPGPGDSAYRTSRHRLLRLVKALACVPVVRHRITRRPRASGSIDREAAPRGREGSLDYEIAALGASTGGPPLIAQVLRDLPTVRRLPLVLVQHMTTGFGSGFVRWLASTTGHRVLLVDRRIELEGSTVYVAQPDTHLVFASPTAVVPSDHLPCEFQKPSINTLFKSAAQVFGDKAIGILLTGMGEDGAAGMEALHKAGATTVCQHPATCVVPSMPLGAIERGAAGLVLSPERIGAWLAGVAKSSLAPDEPAGDPAESD